MNWQGPVIHILENNDCLLVVFMRAVWPCLWCWNNTLWKKHRAADLLHTGALGPCVRWGWGWGVGLLEIMSLRQNTLSTLNDINNPLFIRAWISFTIVMIYDLHAGQIIRWDFTGPVLRPASQLSLFFFCGGGSRRGDIFPNKLLVSVS